MKSIIQEPIPDEPLMNSRDVMNYLRISRSTLLRLMANGTLPARKLGYHWKFQPEEVRAIVTTKGKENTKG